jgi:putative ABC transport system permease protein
LHEEHNVSMRNRLQALFRRGKAERELDEELRFHIEERTRENVAAGMPPEEARNAALRQFGNVVRLKEDTRAAWTFPCFETLFQDVRYGLRQLRRNPGFTAVAILTLALGIGANAAIFSVLYRDLLRPLPYPNGDRLVMFGMVVPALETTPFLFDSSYLEIRNERTPFESMASWIPGVSGCDLAAQHPARLACARAESTFMPTFGVNPVLGRNFTSAEDKPDAPQVCLISHALWQSRFGGNPAALGQVLVIDGAPTRIVGVLPRDFEWPTLVRVDIVLPEKLPSYQANMQPRMALRAYARLKPGVNIAQARAQLEPIVQQFIQSAPPQFRKEIRLGLISVREAQTGSIRRALWVLFGATLALLLVASANVTNLLLARSEAREREFAVRAALGATRWRLARLRLIESTLLGLGGGVIGAGLAFLVLRTCIALAPAGIPRLTQVQLGLPGVLLLTGMSLFSGVLCGLGSLAAVRTASLHLAGRATGSPRGRLGPALVASQVAVSLVLLVGAGLLLDTLRNIGNIPLGMDTNHIMAAEITLGSQDYRQPGQAVEFFQRLETRLGALPGVTGVVVSDSLPPTGLERARPFSSIRVEGRPASEKGAGGLVGWRAVTPGYLRMLDIPIVEGRGFIASDRDADADAIVLSRTLANRLFRGASALHQRMQLDPPSGPWYDVVGVAGDVKNGGLIRNADPEYYVVRKNAPDLGLAEWPGEVRHAYFLVRSPLAVDGVEKMMRGAIASLDPALPVEISTLDDRVGRLLAGPKFDAALIGLFAALGLVLVAVGLYGLVSYAVASRTQEIGIRMALGAKKHDVLRMVIGQGLKLTLMGVAIGIIGALGLTRFLASLLYGVKPTDPLAFAAVSLVLIIVSLLACYIPARRAAKVDPMVALRYE